MLPGLGRIRRRGQGAVKDAQGIVGCPGEKALNLRGNGRKALRGDQQEDIVCISDEDIARERRTPIGGINDEGHIVYIAEFFIALAEMGQTDEVMPWNLV